MILHTLGCDVWKASAGGVVKSLPLVLELGAEILGHGEVLVYRAGPDVGEAACGEGRGYLGVDIVCSAYGCDVWAGATFG